MLDFLRMNARWLAAGFLMMFMSSFGQTYFISLFSGEIRGALDLSHGAFGTIYGVATLASAASLIWVGKIVDRDNLALVGVFIALALASAALGMAFAAGPIALFVVIYALRLFGQGMMMHTAQTAIGRWFVATRGRALAISGIGFPTSEAILPLLTVALVAWLDWRAVWVLAACVLVFFTAPALFLLLRQNRASAARSEATKPVKPQRQWSRVEVLRDPFFYVLMSGLLAPSFIGTGVFFHQVHMVDSKGWQLAWFAGAFPLYAGVSVASGLAAGVLIDRFTAKRLLPVVLVPQAIGTAVLGLTDGVWVIPVFMVLMGMTAGLMATVTGAIWPELYGTRHLGAIRSLAMAAMVFATAGSPFVLGILIDRGVAFDHQLAVMGLYMGAAAIVLFGASRVLLHRGDASVESKG